MKLLYFILAFFAAAIGVYFVLNNFHYDSATFSFFLIKSLTIEFVLVFMVICVVFLVNKRKKQHLKGIMTIKEYFQYKNIR